MMMYPKPKKRVKSKSAQKKYFESNRFDEYFKSRGILVNRDEVHEIVFGTRKTYEDWNMIALTRENHRLAHDGTISRRELLQIKIDTGYHVPESIRGEYDL